MYKEEKTPQPNLEVVSRQETTQREEAEKRNEDGYEHEYIKRKRYPQNHQSRKTEKKAMLEKEERRNVEIKPNSFRRILENDTQKWQAHTPA